MKIGVVSRSTAFRITLATTSAATILMTASAMAGSGNNTFIDQNGAGNTAWVNQLGYFNEVGANSATLRVLQNGDNNALSVSQENNYGAGATGEGNKLGIERNGVNQDGNNNTITTVQGHKKNKIAELQQFSAATGTGAERINVIEINQSEESTVARVTQTNSSLGVVVGDRNLVDIDQLNKGNKVGGLGSPNDLQGITQNGVGNTVDLDQMSSYNVVWSVRQFGTANTATLLQKGGNSNQIDLILQDSTLAASGNTATITLDGTDNGGVALTGAANASGATHSTVQQIGGGNLVGYMAVGSYNQFGFYQSGTGNEANNILVTGNYNQLGVKQTGETNKLLLASISGSDNNIGLIQTGDSNAASLSIGGSGNRNGGYAGFTGAPASTAGLTAGLLEQLGDWNSVSLTVTGSDNVFATMQNSGAYAGSSVTNTIVGTISGDFNQVAVKQVGVGNLTTFIQSGSSNNAYISQ